LLERLSRPTPDGADWDRLVAVYSPLLRGWLCRFHLQGADADDLLQEVLTVLLKKVGRFRHDGHPGAFRSWLRTILAFEVRAFHRRRRSWPQTADPNDENGPLADLEKDDSELTRRWDAEHDRHVVARLLELIRPEFSATTWQAFERSVLPDRSAAEVAAEMGLTANAVWVARSRVLQRLREEARGLLVE
jgi:RNA polymerase sigma-70 factor (ECF subfamily)